MENIDSMCAIYTKTGIGKYMYMHTSAVLLRADVKQMDKLIMFG